MKMQSEKMKHGYTSKYSPKMLQALCHLKRWPVKIPFADKIVDVFPSKKISERRNFERFFDFIKSVTCVHQYQRQSDGEFLIAEPQDYDKARDIFMNIQQGVSSIPLNTRQKDIVEVLKKSGDRLGLTNIHTQLKHHLALQNLRPHVDSLVNLKVLDKYHELDKFNRELIVYCLSEDYLNFKPIILPNSMDLLYSNDSNNNNGSNSSNGGNKELKLAF